MKRKKRVSRRKKWTWIMASLLLLLLVILFSLPSVLSTAPCRQLILARVNRSLSGQAKVGQWSLGWWSGVRIQDLSFKDQLGSTEVTVKGIQAKPRLASFLTGHGSLGHTVIDQPKVRLTVQPLDGAGQRGSGQAGFAGLPISDLDLEVRDGVIEVVGLDQRVSTLSNVQTRLTLTPQTSQLVLAASVPNGPDQGEIEANLAVDQSVSKPWDLKGTSGQWQVDVNGLDLGSLEAVLSLAKLDLDLKGVVNAQVNGQVTQGRIDHVKGKVSARQLEASGDLLKGDRVATQDLAVDMDLVQEGESFQINSLSVNSDWMTSKLKGAIPTDKDKAYTMSGSFDIDVAAVASQLPRTLSIKPGMQVSQGRASGQFDVSGAQIDGQVRLENLKGLVDHKEVALSQPLAAQVKMRMDKGLYQVEALDLTSSFAGIKASGNAEKIQFTEWVDLGLMQTELGRFINMGPLKMAGRLSSEGTVVLAGDQWRVTGTSVFDQLNLTNPLGLSLAEPRSEMAFEVSYDTKQQRVDISSLNLSGSFGTVGCDASQINLQTKAADIQARVTGLDLERLTQYGALFDALPKGMALKGKADSQLHCQIQGPRINATTGQTRVTALSLTMPEKAPFVQDYVDLTCEVSLDVPGKSIDVRALELTTPQIKISKVKASRSVEGDFTRVQAEATCQYDLKAIQGVVADLLPEGLDMAGQRTGHIQFDSTYATADPNGLFAAASGKARFGFDRAAYMGLEFGSTDVNAVFDGGVLKVERFETQVNQGLFAFASSTDFRAKPVLMSVPGPMAMAQSVRVTPATTQQLFRYMNPLFANLTQVSGEFSFMCDRLELPLKQQGGRELEMQGTLAMKDVVLQGSSLLTDILSQVNTGPINAQRIEVAPTEFTVKDGVVQYDDMPIIVGDNPVNFSGRIGLDDRLEMTVMLPYTRSGRTVRVGEDAQDRWVVALAGTINQPQIKMESVIDQLLETGIERGLKELFR